MVTKKYEATADTTMELEVDPRYLETMERNENGSEVSINKI